MSNRHFHEAFTSRSAQSKAAAVCIPPLPAHRRGRARWPATAQPRPPQPIRLSVHRRRAGASSGRHSKASRRMAAPTAQHRRCRAETITIAVATTAIASTIATTATTATIATTTIAASSIAASSIAAPESSGAVSRPRCRQHGGAANPSHTPGVFQHHHATWASQYNCPSTSSCQSQCTCDTVTGVAGVTGDARALWCVRMWTRDYEMCMRMP